MAKVIEHKATELPLARYVKTRNRDNGYGDGDDNKHHMTVVREFASTAQMGLCAERGCDADESDSRFYGSMSKSEAIKTCFTGDVSAVERAREMIESLQEHLSIEVPRWNLSPAGAFPSVPDFIAGHPDCMRRRELEANDRAPIRIFACSTSSASFSASQLEKRGTAILALAMGLSAMRPVTLYTVGAFGASDYHGVVYATQIPASPLELSTASYALSSPAFARRINYGVAKAVNEFNGMWPWDGNPNGEKSLNILRECLNIGPNDILVEPIYTGTDESHTNPVAWVKKNLLKFGIES